MPSCATEKNATKKVIMTIIIMALSISELIIDSAGKCFKFCFALYSVIKFLWDVSRGNFVV